MVTECIICQRSKGKHVCYSGLLQPMLVPSRPWTNVSLDFIESLFKSHHKDAIVAVIDKFFKYGHFIALSHHFHTKKIANIFFDNIHKLHGLPNTIVSDRDPIFISQF